MRARQVGRYVGAVVAMTWLMVTTAVSVPSAAAASCPDIEVVFARGTSELPGIGWVGQSFVSALRWKVGWRSVQVYAVNYPASFDYSNSANAGARDANARVRHVAATCPRTKIVLGGMSQGAGVIDLITIGARTIWFFTPVPLPQEVAAHVAAVAVFANPSRNIPLLGPLTTISPQYGSKTIDLCAPGDPICSTGTNLLAHFSYPLNGMADGAATFVAARL